MERGIRLDERHGLNPSLEQCFYCMEAKGVVLFGKINPAMRNALAKDGLLQGRDAGEAPRQICLNKEPCTKCKAYMERGVILISVDEEKSTDKQNPYRTGGWVVVTEDYIKRVVDHPLCDAILDRRLAFIPDDAWNLLGLPRDGQAVNVKGE